MIPHHRMRCKYYYFFFILWYFDFGSITSISVSKFRWLGIPMGCIERKNCFDAEFVWTDLIHWRMWKIPIGQWNPVGYPRTYAVVAIHWNRCNRNADFEKIANNQKRPHRQKIILGPNHFCWGRGGQSHQHEHSLLWGRTRRALFTETWMGESVCGGERESERERQRHTQLTTHKNVQTSDWSARGVCHLDSIKCCFTFSSTSQFQKPAKLKNAMDNFELRAIPLAIDRPMHGMASFF